MQSKGIIIIARGYSTNSRGFGEDGALRLLLLSGRMENVCTAPDVHSMYVGPLVRDDTSRLGR